MSARLTAGLSSGQFAAVERQLRWATRHAGEIFAEGMRQEAERLDKQRFMDLRYQRLAFRNRLILLIDRTSGKTRHRRQYSVPLWVASNDEGTRLSTTPRGPSVNPSCVSEGFVTAA